MRAQLRMEVVISTYQNMIASSPFLVHAFHQSVPFVVAFCMHLQMETFHAGDTIIEEAPARPPPPPLANRAIHERIVSVSVSVGGLPAPRSGRGAFSRAGSGD